MDQEARQEPLRLRRTVNVIRRLGDKRRRSSTCDETRRCDAVVDDILDPDNTASEVRADSAYRVSAGRSAKPGGEVACKSRTPRCKGHVCNAHHLRELQAADRDREGRLGATRCKGRRACHAANLARERVRGAASSTSFEGFQSNDMGGTLTCRIAGHEAPGRGSAPLRNLAYNMRRLVQLERLAAYRRTTFSYVLQGAQEVCAGQPRRGGRAGT